MVLGLSNQRNSENSRKSKTSISSGHPPVHPESIPPKSDLDLFKVYPLVDAIFSDLVDRHKRLVSAGRRSEVMMNQLRTRYTQQMQRVLLNAVGMEEVEKPTCRSNVAFVMHREHFEQQVERLARTVVGQKIHRFRDLLLEKRKSQGKEDRQMLEEYGDDAQPSNALWKLFCKEMPVDQRNYLTAIMESNFASLLDQLDMDEDLARFRTSISNSSVQEALLEPKTQITPESMAATRAQWVQYFANRSRTSFEQKLSALHLQRKEAVISQKLQLKRIRMEKRQELLNHRPLTELHTNPRLTHRMRQVLAERAAQARRQTSQESAPAPPAAKQRRPQTASKRLRMADVVLKTMKDRDTCCKCRLFPSRINGC
ncbi:uncharacterized protein LOC111068350 [Drosophila obscura]|uniref:uncharacterized protein LOC111068350 n=1 Tax=Drosophila obscura TaxID=7282 RepID=UPI001BB0DBF8|nr:uncharacterized protein LOC111068350 [Drosophila obscura]